MQVNHCVEVAYRLRTLNVETLDLRWIIGSFTALAGCSTSAGNPRIDSGPSTNLQRFNRNGGAPQRTLLGALCSYLLTRQAFYARLRRPSQFPRSPFNNRNNK